jgi:UDP-GlcNAc:undecaprenyl-phosphate GlcNAc-1-phosphate transferase
MPEFLQGWPATYLLVFTVAVALSFVLTAISLRVLPRLGIMDQPNERKLHTTPVPRMGGVAVYVAFALSMVLSGQLDGPQKGVIIGSGVALLIGMVDDIRGVPAPVKLVFLFLLTLLMHEFDVATNLPCPIPGISPNLFNLAVTMLWLTGICSAMNALDHMDALAGGIAVIAALSYVAVSIQTGQMLWGLTSIALVGGLVGFLWYNRHPAQIFLGDSGSFFLGFSLAAIGIMGGWSERPVKAAIVPIAVLSLPIFDFIYVLVVRHVQGTTHGLREAISYCGKDHFGHRLLGMGFRQVAAARLAYLLAATVAISALVLRDTEGLEAWLLVIQVIMIYSVLSTIMITIGLRRPPEPRKSA